MDFCLLVLTNPNGGFTAYYAAVLCALSSGHHHAQAGEKANGLREDPAQRMVRFKKVCLSLTLECMKWTAAYGMRAT